MLHAAFVRSPHAHALIRGIDARAARARARRACGAHARRSVAAAVAGALPLQFRTAQLPPDITPFVLAKDEVAFVGEAVAVVIAETRYLAEDAAALVAVDYEPLPAVSDCRAALAPGAPLAHRGRKQQRDAPSSGSPTATSRPRLRARRIARRVSLKQHRGGAHSIEGRGALARLRRERGPADAVDLDAARPRGARLPDAPAACSTRTRCAWSRPMSAAASAPSSSCIRRRSWSPPPALMLRRPVKWIEDRREHFLVADAGARPVLGP